MSCPPPPSWSNCTGISQAQAGKGALPHSPLHLTEPVALHQVSNVWVNLEAHLLILGRAHADPSLHSPLKWLCFRGTSSSCLSQLHPWPTWLPVAAEIPMPSRHPAGVGVGSRGHTNQKLLPRWRQHCTLDPQDMLCWRPTGIPLMAPTRTWFSVLVPKSSGTLLIH